jgi:hypothetical protein
MKQRSKFLHELLSETLDLLDLSITFTSATDNGNGTHTLNEVCNFKYIYPGQYVSIDGANYKVESYDTTSRAITVKALDGAPAITVTTFNLRKPLFVHGHPIQQDNELRDIKIEYLKGVIIYLMEPFGQKKPPEVDSSIDRWCDFTLCFLCEARVLQLSTDGLYYAAIRPMQNLMEDFMEVVQSRRAVFNVNDIGEQPTIHSKFGINIQDTGTPKSYFSKNLSGISNQIKLGIYQGNTCDDCDVTVSPSPDPEPCDCPDPSFSDPLPFTIDDNGSALWNLTNADTRWSYEGSSDEPLSINFGQLEGGWYFLEITFLQLTNTLTLGFFTDKNYLLDTDGEHKLMNIHIDSGDDAVILITPHDANALAEIPISTIVLRKYLEEA